ncbi:MAG TPA: hypothetical protein PLP33_24875 [Leptospiraceae bacterium]|nr:hypothetical protein [Leptospiraceae bacterium]
MNIFEKASKTRLRFASRQGQLSTEDLWDLSLSSLDTIAKAVNKELKSEQEESFIPDKTKRPNATHNALRLEILKHIIGVKVEESEASTKRAENAAKLARLKELAANKVDEVFAQQSLEEIQKQIAELEAQN